MCRWFSSLLFTIWPKRPIYSHFPWRKSVFVNVHRSPFHVFAQSCWAEFHFLLMFNICMKQDFPEIQDLFATMSTTVQEKAMTKPQLYCKLRPKITTEEFLFSYFQCFIYYSIAIIVQQQCWTYRYLNLRLINRVKLLLDCTIPTSLYGNTVFFTL